MVNGSSLLNSKIRKAVQTAKLYNKKSHHYHDYKMFSANIRACLSFYQKSYRKSTLFIRLVHLITLSPTLQSSCLHLDYAPSRILRFLHNNYLFSKYQSRSKELLSIRCPFTFQNMISCISLSICSLSSFTGT